MMHADRPLGAGRPMTAGAVVAPRGVHRRQALLAGAAMVFGAGSGARASVAPAEVRTALPSAVLSGSTRFTYWGFSVYDASLWVLPGFDPREYERHRFALHLQYLRNFTNAAITERSVDEMTRQSGAGTQRRALWSEWLRNAFPDVRAGDRITGINQPGEGALFVTNGRQTGSIPDPAFARLFFGIWLASDTSEPAMRTALISGKVGS